MMSSVELKQAYNSKDLENEKDNTNGSTADLEEGEPIDVYTPEKLQPRTKKFIIFVAWVAAMVSTVPNRRTRRSALTYA